MPRARWTRPLVGTTGLVAVTVLLAGCDPWPVTDPGPTTTPTTPTTVPPSSSPPDVTPEADDDGGLLDGLLEDLLGGMDPARLAACIGAPDGSPEPLPDDPDAAIDEIADQVAEERELDFLDPVDPQLLPPDELAERIVELSAEDLSADAADVDGRLLAALGAVEPGTDMRQLQLDLLAGQVAGFYDPESGELTAVAADGLDPTARMTLAHELDHALTDQAIGLPDLDGFTGRSDEGLATLAVIEGDASLLMQRWAVQQLTLLEQLATAGAAFGPAEQLRSVPWLIQQQLVFPYTSGLTFVCEQFAGGGWGAVDALYADPPTTTAQVLWPERYEAREGAVDVPDPTLPDGWEEVRRDQLGAADLLWLFQAPGNDRAARLSDAEDRATAWAGGELVAGTRGAATAVAITLAEHPDATIPLCDSITAWYGAAFPDATATTTDGTTYEGPDQAAVIICTDDLVDLTISPDRSADTATG